MHSIDLYMLSMLHTTFWSVSEVAARRSCQISLDTVTAPFGGLQQARGRQTVRTLHTSMIAAACNDVTVPRVADTEMSHDPPCLLTTDAGSSYKTGLSHGVCRSKHAVRLVTNINIVSKTEGVRHMVRGEGQRGIRSSGEDTAR